MEPKDSLVLPQHHPHPPCPKSSWPARLLQALKKKPKLVYMLIGMRLASLILDFCLTYRQFALVSSEWQLPHKLIGYMSEYEYLRVRHVNKVICKTTLWSLALEAMFTCLVLLTNSLPWIWQKVGNVIQRLRTCCCCRRKRVAVDGFEEEEPVGEIKQSLVFFIVLSLLTSLHTDKSSIQSMVFCLFLQFLSLPFLAFTIYVLKWKSRYGKWIFLWLLVAPLPFLVTDLVMPVVDTQYPLPDGQLKLEIDQFAAKLQFPLENIHVAESSAIFPNVSNAYYAGIFVQKRIVFFDTLLGYAPGQLEEGILPNATASKPNMTNPEVIAILAHELGHWKGQHLLYKFVFLQVRLVIGLVMLAVFYQNKRLHSALGFGKEKPIIVGLFIVAYFVSLPLTEPLAFINNIISRQMEYSADRFAVHYKYAKQLCHALLKLRTRNQLPIEDHLYSLFKRDHAGTLERCDKMGVEL